MPEIMKENRLKSIIRLWDLIIKLSEGFIKSKKEIMLWDLLYIGVIGLNSYILLIYNNRQEPELIYVICAAAAIYVVTLILLLIKLRRHKRRREILYSIRKIFRIIYTAVYLTIIMLHIIRMGSFETISNEQRIALIYNISMFFIIAAIGTSSFWLKKVIKKVLKASCR
jgi:hypothetical protein